MKIFASVVFVTVLILAGFVQSHADDMELLAAPISPDALIVLDLSSSMKWTTSGGTMYIATSQACGSDSAYYPTSGTGHTLACAINPDLSVPKYGDSSCSGPFYITSTHVGYSTDCSRLAIAKRSIFALLDDNADSAINSQDETSLGIRLGYMRFLGGDDTAGDYSSGNIKLSKKNITGCTCPPTLITTGCAESTDALGLGSSYIDIYNRISCENGSSGTPLASSLNEAKLYLDANKAGDSAKACRKKFVILVTDGEDTYTCSGNGQDTQADQYKRRRESVARAKALADAGYKVFVVGFGANMPAYLTNTLNWMAYYGGTDNTLDANLGNTSQYSIPSGSLYPSGIAGCQAIASPDPGALSLSGYAFFAGDASQLSTDLKTIKNYIQQTSSYSGSTASSVRIINNDTVYIPSCQVPSWNGDLQAYQLDANGTLPVDATTQKITEAPIWSAGQMLNLKDPANRNIYTYSNGTFKTFVSTNLTNAELGVTSDTARLSLINYVRGVGRTWKLGDILHSNPVYVGEPSRFFDMEGSEGFGGTGGFYQANKNRTPVVIVGANDGMLHAFNAATGDEAWGYIPNSVLKNLQSMMSLHTYYVDSSPKAADVWFYNTSTDRTKTADEWKTVLVCGLRKGGITNVVLGTDGKNYTCIQDHTAAAANCPITGASWATYWAQQGTGGGTWASGTGYYAKTWRYFALDITDTLNPKYLWAFPDPSDGATLAKVGQSWSEPAIGRVKIEIGGDLYERWVAFVGGGFDYANSTGKGLFVVDIKTGAIIKEFSGLSGMNYSFAAPPTTADTNSDGFVDKVYIGDLGGQMWVFNVSFNDATKKSDSQWSGTVLFKGPDTETHRIYYQPTVAFDQKGNPWVYFGTGDREYPKDLSNPQERIYAVIDNDNEIASYPRREANLADVTLTSTNTFTDVRVNDSTKKGWLIKLTKASDRLEKVLARPTVFNRLVYFSTYTYIQTSDACSVLDEARAYIVEYLSGGGAFAVDEMSDFGGTPGDRSTKFGVGIPSTPVIKVDSTGKASVIIGSTSGQVYSAKAFSPSNKQLLYWREVIP
ncbi:MAG: PilC/PilY family type IV pilus protein [Thermodesulfobacteriota bacterium]